MSKIRDLYIIGASHLGRELESWLELIPPEKRDWKIKGFLHTYFDKSPLDGYPSDYKILGEWENYPLTREDYCIISIADVAWRKKIYLHLKGKVTFFTYMAPNTTVGKFVEIGEGAFICPQCIIATHVRVGNNVFINCISQIGHDTIIGDHSSIMADVAIGGNCKIGESVFIGSNSAIIPETIIEEESSVGVGSIVLRKVKKNTSVFGNPATVIK
jgi:sugar O-acyltransferase (sialic acid O-acetyltransferase NeuD family)